MRSPWTSRPARPPRDGGVRVRGIGVAHADVPAVGYRGDVGNVSPAFSRDQNGSDPAFVEFVRDVDVLVHASRPRRSLDRTGERTACPAERLGFPGDRDPRRPGGRVPRFHLLAAGLADSPAHQRAAYGGPVTVGEDLRYVPLP